MKIKGYNLFWPPGWRHILPCLRSSRILIYIIYYIITYIRFGVYNGRTDGKNNRFIKFQKICRELSCAKNANYFSFFWFLCVIFGSFLWYSKTVGNHLNSESVFPSNSSNGGNYGLFLNRGQCICL